MLQNIETTNRILLPSLGEGVESGIVVGILIIVGDQIEKEQTIIEVETDKATMEVPSPASGTVQEILIKEGDTIEVGQVIIHLKDDLSSSPPTGNIKEIEEVNEQSDTHIPEKEIVHNELMNTSINVESTSHRATPKAKKLARELHVDINSINNKGESITVNRVKTHVSQTNHGLPSLVNDPTFDHTIWGQTEEQPLTGMQRATSQNMSLSWSTIPHAWLTENANITKLEALRKDINTDNEIKLSATVYIIKAIAHALEKFPLFNASLDLARETIVYKKYINVGVAVDTEFGLYVPVIKRANQLPLNAIASELKKLSELAKNRKLSKDDMEGGTITLSNLGGIGTSSIFPIILSPQVAIIGISSYQKQMEDKLLPVTIGFDHRIINGADAARFIQHIKTLLESPVKMLV